MIQNYADISDSEIISLLGENDENVTNVIYDKYGYLIDYVLNKHRRLIKMYHVDKEELLAEASLGFSDGIHCFQVGKNTSLKTFLTICIERRVLKIINRSASPKKMVYKNSLSIDYTSENSRDLIDTLTDGKDPLSDLTSVETYNEVAKSAKTNLSEFEYEVFIYMLNNTDYKKIAMALDKTPKQIDNTIQRIKLKMRKALEKNI